MHNNVYDCICCVLVAILGQTFVLLMPILVIIPPLTMSNTISTYGKAWKSSTHKYHCTFGAGMALLQSYISDDEPEVIIENCTFEHNYAQQYGGGVFISCECNIIFRNPNISNNTAYHGSGMVLHTFHSSLYNFYFATVVFYRINKFTNSTSISQNMSSLLLVFY